MSILPKRIFNFNSKSDYISATELAKFFSIEPRELNQILTNMGWIEKNITSGGLQRNLVMKMVPLSTTILKIECVMSIGKKRLCKTKS